MKILGLCDSVNSCQCCGKQGLKHTVAIDFDGEILYYGSSCARKPSGLNSKEIKSEIQKRQEFLKNKIQEELLKSSEYKFLNAKRNEAFKLNLEGRDFMKYCSKENELFLSLKENLQNKYDELNANV